MLTNLFHIYGISDSIYSYLHIIDVLKFSKILSTSTCKHHKFIKEREIEICDPEYGEKLIHYFENIKFALTPLPKINLQSFNNISSYITKLDLFQNSNKQITNYK